MVNIEISRLFVCYDDYPVLKGIDLEVAEGEFLGIIGPNGSGKSTLLKSISGIFRDFSGEIKVRGRSIRRWRRRQLARMLAVVPQDTTISFDFTVLEVVMMGRSPYLRGFQAETAHDLDVVRRAMEFTECWQLRDRSINELSGGERQRAVIARALAQEPHILLLDEPTTHLDINHQVEIFDLLASLNTDEGMTILAVSHDLNLAAAYCSKLMLLDKGRIHSIGTPGEILRREVIEDVYQTPVIIGKNPATGSPNLMLMPSELHGLVQGKR
ncbi:MAG TPA: heme ABC transporter ATP-binding protein [Candidatus Latescibacteria bacterium]|nr:heme ABC transporter ATP-binding protein [Candidatus Latescibacterota bacterium]